MHNRSQQTRYFYLTYPLALYNCFVPASMTFLSNAQNTNLSCSTLNDFQAAGNQTVIYNSSLVHSNEDEQLGKLDPVQRTGYPVVGCLQGTRKAVLKEISIWLDDTNATNNILWISSSPGAGKSALAKSLVEKLEDEGRLASCFFFKRGHDDLSNPTVVWRTIAFDLTKFHPGLKARILETLKSTSWNDFSIRNDFRRFIKGSLTKNDGEPYPVIILDALDECGCDKSQSEQRRLFFDTLVEWSRDFPQWCKLIVTSRDGPPSSFKHKSIVLETGNSNTESTDDIRIFFKDSFEYITNRRRLQKAWPGEPTVEELTARAAGLFVWAKTTIDFLDEADDNHSNRLRLILEGKAGKGMEVIDSLYRQILHFAFPEGKDSTFELFREVVGAIIIAKEPFHRNDLEYFVSRNDRDEVGNILGKLSAVIREGKDGLLHVAHLSFVEFLSDIRRCNDARLVIDPSKHHRNLALACLRLMNRELKFNIGDVKTSHCFNDVTKPIPSHLSYSCRFWAEHLDAETTDPRVFSRYIWRLVYNHDRYLLLEEIRYFIYNQFLFWLEVLSLIKKVPVAQPALLNTIRWLGVSSCHVFMSNFI